MYESNKRKITSWYFDISGCLNVQQANFFPELHEATKLVDRRTSSFRFYFFRYDLGLFLFFFFFFFFLVAVCFSSVVRAHRRCTATMIVARSSKWIVRADREQETTQRERENTAEKHGCCLFVCLFFLATIFKNAYTCVKKGGNITRGMQTVTGLLDTVVERVEQASRDTYRAIE